MTQEKQQAIFEINRTLSRIISAFRFTPEQDAPDMYVRVRRSHEDYGSVTIYDDQKWNDGTLTHLIRARGSVCQMNANLRADDLRWAADQIQRAAGLVDAINALELHYTEEQD